MSRGKEKNSAVKLAPHFHVFWWFLSVDKLSVCAKD